jgi:hypothetical protein
MAAPLIKWYVETAGLTASLSETLGNWQELSSSEESHSQLLFASGDSTSSVLLPMERPAQGGSTTVPDSMFLREETSLGISYNDIKNWGKAYPNGLYTFCAKFTAADAGTVLISKPRLEAYDSFNSAFIGKASESVLLTGTTATNDQPLLRAIDTTAEALSFDVSPIWPPQNWWFDSTLTYGTTDGNRIKYINGSSSFLEPGIVVVPEGGSTIMEGTTYTESSTRVSSEFYFSIAPVIPDDVLRGQDGKDVVILIRSFYA